MCWHADSARGPGFNSPGGSTFLPIPLLFQRSMDSNGPDYVLALMQVAIGLRTDMHIGLLRIAVIKLIIHFSSPIVPSNPHPIIKKLVFVYE